VGPLAIVRLLRRVRRHRAGLLVALVVASAIAMHHGALAGDRMHDGTGAIAAVEICLAVVAVGTAVAAAGVALIAGIRLRPPVLVLPAGARIGASASRTWARAGPPLLTTLCVCRR
jgi:hypothetical protein